MAVGIKVHMTNRKLLIITKYKPFSYGQDTPVRHSQGIVISSMDSLTCSLPDVGIEPLRFALR